MNERDEELYERGKELYEAHMRNFLLVPMDFLPKLADDYKWPLSSSIVWEIVEGPESPGAVPIQSQFLLTLSGGGWVEPSAFLLNPDGSTCCSVSPRHSKVKTGRWLKWDRNDSDSEQT